MADVFDKAKRSEVMSRIRGSGNRSTEIAFAVLLRRGGITGWRRRQGLAGKPDFTFASAKLAVFIDGCFWHGCPRHCKMPVTNAEFWHTKLAVNKKRDRSVNQLLRKRGWLVVRIWECHLAENPDACLAKVELALSRQSAGLRLRNECSVPRLRR